MKGDAYQLQLDDHEAGIVRGSLPGLTLVFSDTEDGRHCWWLLGTDADRDAALALLDARP